MKENNKKSGNGTENNTNNVESNNNVYRLIEKTSEQLTASASRYDERAENGQKITFTKAEQKKAVGNAANADSDGYLAGIFWTGYVVTTDGQRHDFERLDSNGISRHFANVCTWKRATRASLLDGNSTRTHEQRTKDAQKAIEEAKAKPAPNSVTAILWNIIEDKFWEDEDGNDIQTSLHNSIVKVMETADANAAEKAQSKESKTAQRERELAEAKQAAAAAESATESAIKLLLATGQYKTEEEVRKALGL